MDSPFCCLVRLCLHPFYRFGAMAVELFCQGKTTRKAMYIKRYSMMCDVFFFRNRDGLANSPLAPQGNPI